MKKINRIQFIISTLLFLIFCNITYANDGCPFETCEIIYRYDLKNDFTNDAPGSECTDITTYSFVGSDNLEYTHDRVSLIARRSDKSYQCNDAQVKTRQYSTARLKAKKDFDTVSIMKKNNISPATGYIQFKAKNERNNPSINSLWPGLWLLSNTSDFIGEIDIFEANFVSKSYFSPKIVINHKQSKAQKQYVFPMKNDDGIFATNIYGLSWDCDTDSKVCNLNFYLNNKAIITNIKIISANDPTKCAYNQASSDNNKNYEYIEVENYRDQTICDPLGTIYNRFVKNGFNPILSLHVGNKAINLSPDSWYTGSELGKLSVYDISLMKVGSEKEHPKIADCSKNDLELHAVRYGYYGVTSGGLPRQDIILDVTSPNKDVDYDSSVQYKIYNWDGTRELSDYKTLSSYSPEINQNKIFLPLHDNFTGQISYQLRKACKNMNDGSLTKSEKKRFDFQFSNGKLQK